MKKLLSSLLGVVVALTWWTIRGSNTHVEQAQAIPAKVWNGGGGTIAISVDSTIAGRLSVEFIERKDGGRQLETGEQVGPGAHSWSVEVPHNAGGYVEFQADAPKVGDRMSWTIAYNGKQIAQDEMTLQQPLQSNEAFFLQEHYDDYSRLHASDD